MMTYKEKFQKLFLDIVFKQDAQLVDDFEGIEFDYLGKCDYMSIGKKEYCGIVACGGDYYLDDCPFFGNTEEELYYNILKAFNDTKPIANLNL